MKNPFSGQLRIVDGSVVNILPTIPVVLNELDNIVCTFPAGWSEEAVRHSLRMLEEAWDQGYQKGWNEAKNPFVTEHQRWQRQNLSE